jgi:AbiTii
MSLLRQIQEATIDPKFKLADVLRMCTILAAHLDHPDFKEWIKLELNGYKDSNQLPDYRILRNLGCRGDFLGSFGSSIKNAPIPSISLPNEFRELASTKYILQSVSALESVVGQANKANEFTLRNMWPADCIALL